MAAADEWRPTPTCPKAHTLEEKTVAGSWWASSKSCSGCGASLKAGTRRHSCKACGHHLCSACATRRAEEMLDEEITLTVYRAAQPGLLPGLGVDEDTWQARLTRRATVGALKLKLQELYGLPMGLQELRRDADSPALPNCEALKYDDGDVVYLAVAGGPMGGLATGWLGGLGGGTGGFAEALQSAAAEAAQAMSGAMAEVAARVQELENAEYKLTLVMPSRGARSPERRCQVVVVASARVAELLEMAKAELNLDGEEFALEFAGQRLPLPLPLHLLRLGDGDTILVVAEETTTSL